MTSPTTQQPSIPRGAQKFIIGLLLIVLVVAGLRATVYNTYSIPSESMKPTLNVGDVVFTWKPYLKPPQKGDIVVFKDTEGWLDEPNQFLVKRVIGEPGDTITCCDPKNRILVNGKPVTEPYVSTPNTPFPKVTVPKDHVWVMGDNRGNSADSRAHTTTSTAFIPIKSITGVVFMKQYNLFNFTLTKGHTLFAQNQ